VIAINSRKADATMSPALRFGEHLAEHLIA